MNIKFKTAVVGCLLYSCTVESSTIEKCFSSAASLYSVEKVLLKAIAKVESNYQCDAINENDNGSADFGLMQINNSWEPKLKKMGISWDNVVHDPCTNIHVGAWVLSSNFSEYGSSWYSVGAYNAGVGRSDRTRRNRLKYVNKVKAALASITSKTDDSLMSCG